MFVGHYGVSFTAKAAHPKLPLWLLFVAVQFLDVLWGIFVLLGIEKVRIVPGITARTRRVARGGTVGFVVFGVALVLIQAVVFFGAPPTSATAAAVTALAAYAILAAIAAWLDSRRTPVQMA
jgi:hypothetical protein